MTDTCATCFFFASQTYVDNTGKTITQNGCHRKAPDLSQGPGQAEWPFVQGTDWCGEFSASDPHIYGATLLDIAPYSTYVPVVTATVGTITLATATGRYKQLGKTCFVDMVVDITTNNTGATLLKVTLPIQAATGAAAMLAARGTLGANIRKAHTAFVDSAALVALVALYDGTYPGADGVQIVLSGSYEII